MDLLTKVIAETISKKCNDGSFGVSLINIPFVNYADLVSNINLSKKAEIFFLGFYEKEIESMELVERDIKARDIINTRSIYNAVACDMALGCSSNSVLHLLAIANEAGVDLNMDIFNEISAKVPNLCHLAPAGSTHISDLNRAGGIPAVQAELAKKGLLDLDAILYPKTEEDRWENIGKEFAANLSTYWKLFSGFDGTTVSECDTRIRTFLNSRYEDDREDNAITLRTTGTDETAYYVLRTHNEDVRKVTGGTAEKLEDSVWLIRAEQSEVRITLGASDQRYYYEKGAKNE